MEHGSQKARYGVAIVTVLLAAAPAKAAELSYEVRHERALRDHSGTLTIGEKGVSYRQVRKKKPDQAEHVQFDYRDIQELRISAGRLVLVTYRDRKWLLGIDKEFEFFLPEGKSFEAAYTMLKDKLDRRFVAAIADTQADVLWELPVKLQGTIQGSEGVLTVARDRIVYKTARPGQSRTWRYQDIENVSTTDRYQLTLTTFERAKAHYGSRKGFNFQLKEPLEPQRFDALWRRLNQEQGLQVLTAIEEETGRSK